MATETTIVRFIEDLKGIRDLSFEAWQLLCTFKKRRNHQVRPDIKNKAFFELATLLENDPDIHIFACQCFTKLMALYQEIPKEDNFRQEKINTLLSITQYVIQCANATDVNTLKSELTTFRSEMLYLIQSIKDQNIFSMFRLNELNSSINFMLKGVEKHHEKITWATLLSPSPSRANVTVLRHYHSAPEVTAAFAAAAEIKLTVPPIPRSRSVSAISEQHPRKPVTFEEKPPSQPQTGWQAFHQWASRRDQTQKTTFFKSGHWFSRLFSRHKAADKYKVDSEEPQTHRLLFGCIPIRRRSSRVSPAQK